MCRLAHTCTCPYITELVCTVTISSIRLQKHPICTHTDVPAYMHTCIRTQMIRYINVFSQAHGDAGLHIDPLGWHLQFYSVLAELALQPDSQLCLQPCLSTSSPCCFRFLILSIRSKEPLATPSQHLCFPLLRIFGSIGRRLREQTHQNNPGRPSHLFINRKTYSGPFVCWLLWSHACKLLWSAFCNPGSSCWAVHYLNLLHRFVGGWPVAFAICTFILIWFLIFGVGFGVWAAIKQLVDVVNQLGVFASCYQCASIQKTNKLQG